MKRRQVLRGISAVVGAAAAGCGRTGTSGADFAPSSPFDPDPRAPEPHPTPGPLSPEELLAGVETIVVLMMENRSFDHYLGSRKLLEGLEVDGLTGAESNPAPDGSTVGVFQLDDFTVDDPPHGWDSAHAQWNGGANDGFVKEHAGAGDAMNQVMGYHVRSQLAALYPLADQYATCDRWYCSVMGPTWPNRFYLHAASSNGVKSNLPTALTSVFHLLDDAAIPSKYYFHDLPIPPSYFRFDGLFGIEQFFQDAAAGTLPPVCYVDPKFTGADQNDDHPDSDIQLGQALMASIYSALSQSPQWDRCLFVITYDENGGFYDHVPPEMTFDERAEFSQLGFRVPSVVMGPMVKAGATIHTKLEHVSVISTIGRRFGIEPLNERVKAANDLSVCIDPTLIGAPRKPARIAPVEVSLSKVRDRILRGPRHRSQPELQDLADHGGIPRHLDRRAIGPDVTRRVLEFGKKLGAVRLVD